MRIEIEVRNPEHFGEVLYYAFFNASNARGKRMQEWSYLTQDIKQFWSSVARNVMLSAMGEDLT